MRLLDPALRRSAYSIGRTSPAWTAHRRAPCETAIRYNRYGCFGILQRGDECGIFFCVQRGARRFRRIPSVVNAVKCAVVSNPQAGGPNMRDSKLSRRDMLRASTVLAAGAVLAEPLVVSMPQPTP